jgi:hypothetical protein
MSKYNDFLILYNEYEEFVGNCFREYTKGWRGYPGIEGIEFTHEDVIVTYSIWDDTETLRIPIHLLEDGNVNAIVKLWKDKIEKERIDLEIQKAKEQKSRDLAEFNRLKEKFANAEKLQNKFLNS